MQNWDSGPGKTECWTPYYFPYNTEAPVFLEGFWCTYGSFRTMLPSFHNYYAGTISFNTLNFTTRVSIYSVSIYLVSILYLPLVSYTQFQFSIYLVYWNLVSWKHEKTTIFGRYIEIWSAESVKNCIFREVYWNLMHENSLLRWILNYDSPKAIWGVKSRKIGYIEEVYWDTV